MAQICVNVGFAFIAAKEINIIPESIFFVSKIYFFGFVYSLLCLKFWNLDSQEVFQKQSVKTI